MSNLQIKRKAIIIIFTLTIILLLQTNFNLNSNAKQEPIVTDQLLADQTLRIVTRHDTTITTRFKTEFLATQKAIDLNITDIQFYQATTDAGWKVLTEDPSRGIDLLWGDDVPTFEKMDEWGLIKYIDNATLIDYINLNVPDIIAGIEMKSSDTFGDIIWLSNAISSYGFTVNHDFLDNFGLPVPTTWDDLASPIYYINDVTASIGMADAPLSTSNTKIYQIILQTFGWEEGWSILTRMAGNGRIYPGSVDTRAAVVSEDLGVGMTIDFYGIIAQRENPNCEYIIPEGQSVIIPSPIALGINVDNQEAAEAFIEYIVSLEGQSVWMKEGLDRLPVNEDAFQTSYGQTRIDLYSLYNDTLDNIGIEFNNSLAKANLDTTVYYFHNTITAKHDELQLAWDKMITKLKGGSINSSYFNELVNRLGETCMTLQESIDWNEQYRTDSVFATAKDLEWKTFAKNKYYDIYFELLGYIDDQYEQNDNIEEASVIEDEGFFNLFYKDVDYYSITLENGYLYNFTLDFDQSIIDLDMYLLHPDYSGNTEDILASSSSITTPESFLYEPLETGEFILLIEHYTINPEEEITPANYTLNIEKTVLIPENTMNVVFPFYPLVLVAFIIFRKRRRPR